MRRMSYIVIETHIHIEVLVTVWVQCLLYDTGRMSLFRVNSDYCERIRKSEDIALRQSISSNNYMLSQ